MKIIGDAEETAIRAEEDRRKDKILVQLGHRKPEKEREKDLLNAQNYSPS
jgi:hypothetical protein